MSNIEIFKSKVVFHYDSYFPLTSYSKIFAETMERVF